MTAPPPPPAPGADSAPSLADVLRRELAAGPGRPLVTFYDDATGERVELSVATYANWVAKTAGLLQDELGVEHGQRVLVDLPTHWLGPVWLGAAWSVGAVVSDQAPAEPPDLVVCGPEALEAHARGPVPVVALSLRPLGGRFVDPLPPGVVDFGAVVWGQPDAFFPDQAPAAADPAWQDGEGVLTHAELLRRTAGSVERGARLLTDLNPCHRAGLPTLVGPLQSGGGTVWVRHPDPQGWDARAAHERATARWLSGSGAGPA